MSTFSTIMQSGIATTGAASIVYALTVSGIATTALGARSASRRRAARAVLALLLRVDPREPISRHQRRK
jgi:hypothetical protein